MSLTLGLRRQKACSAGLGGGRVGDGTFGISIQLILADPSRHTGALSVGGSLTGF